jgi:hypothetical protein
MSLPFPETLVRSERMAKGGESGGLAAVERRLSSAIEDALPRKTPDDARLGGLLRVLAPHSAALRAVAVAGVKELLRLEAFDRELYGALLRALVESEDKRGVGLVAAALKTEEFGGLPALSLACFVRDASTPASLTRAAASSRTLTAFAAEVARVCQGEPSGPRLFALAPRIKEANRINLVLDLLFPLAERGIAPKAGAALADALLVLGGSERHLGRWLVMAQLAHLGGDGRALQDAIDRRGSGPDSARAGWSLCAWALDPRVGSKGVRPTTELVARLSHRPSADRDASFLFRMALAKLPEARSMLEALVRARPLGDEVALRSATALIRHYDRPSFALDALEAARASPRESVRSLAAACLFDLGERERAVADASLLIGSEDLCAAIWSALVQLSARSKLPPPIVTESNFRRIHQGFSE